MLDPALMFGPAPHRRTLAAALRDLEHPKPKIRLDALRDLLHYGEESREEVVQALARALGDADHQLRGAAALALADVEGKEALPSLLVAIEDEHLYVRQMALTALGEIGDSRATERLRRALHDERPEVRFQALIAFARVAEGEAELLEASHDEDENIRYIALRVAEEQAETRRERGEPHALSEALLARAIEMLEDGTPKIRVVAAVLLAREGNLRGVSVLLDVIDGRMQTNEAEDEAAAVELAGELELRDALPALERRAFGLKRFTKETFAWQARIALARLGHERAKANILRELRAFSRDKRTMAVVAAAHAHLEEARPALLRMQDQPKLADPTVVADALEKLLAKGT